MKHISGIIISPPLWRLDHVHIFILTAIYNQQINKINFKLTWIPCQFFLYLIIIAGAAAGQQQQAAQLSYAAQQAQANAYQQASGAAQAQAAAQYALKNKQQAQHRAHYGGYHGQAQLANAAANFR